MSLQFAPPTSPNLGLSFPSQLRQVRTVLAEADRDGALEPFSGSDDVRARVVFSLIWTPEHTIHQLGTHETLRFARETLLRGGAVREA